LQGAPLPERPPAWNRIRNEAAYLA
jgi:hypothetical protein